MSGMTEKVPDATTVIPVMQTHSADRSLSDIRGTRSKDQRMHAAGWSLFITQ